MSEGNHYGVPRAILDELQKIGLQTPCADIFTRQRMTELGIDRGTAGRIANFFTLHRKRIGNLSPLADWTLGRFISEKDYASLSRIYYCGPICIEAINKVLISIRQPPFERPPNWKY